MTQHIEAYLAQRQAKINALPRRPIIFKWLQSPDMASSLAVIDRRVGELLSVNEPGAMTKLDQWFLAGDQNFNSITAERYVLHYLRQQNRSLVDHLSGNGIDAHVVDTQGEIGVEITTLNAFLADWIVVERLTEFCRSQPFFDDKGLEITCSIQRIENETKGDTIYAYLEAVGKALLQEDHAAFAELEDDVDYEGSLPGWLSWCYSDETTDLWYRRLTEDLVDKLSTSSKQRQLGQYARNVVFVGVNHVAPRNWAVPSIFAALGGRDRPSYQATVDGLQQFWDASLLAVNGVNGICYYTYSLEQETPFYPLHMFWRTGEEPVSIVL